MRRTRRSRRFCGGGEAGAPPPPPPEPDTGRTGSLACPAVEALVNVRTEPVVLEVDHAQACFLDLPHPSTRAIALVVKGSERRTAREAETAVDAVPDAVKV